MGIRLTTKHKPANSLSSGDVFVLDDDVAIGQLLKSILTIAGFKVTCFTDFTTFLSAVRSNPPACVILDVFISGKSGLDILDQLHMSNVRTPVFMMSGRSNIATAVDSMKKGARDFFEKPFSTDRIVSSIRNAIDEHPAYLTTRNGNNTAVAENKRFSDAILTARERVVLNQIIDGTSNKDIGEKLGISYRTVEFHRANLMAKLGARNTADLIRLTLGNGS
jgi:FixJ family two-component response regulator